MSTGRTATAGIASRCERWLLPGLTVTAGYGHMLGSSTRIVAPAGSARQGAVLARARDLVRYARKHGYNRAEPISIIESIAD